MKSFSSINQFRHIVEAMKYNDINELNFKGSVKLHGTNVGISYQEDRGLVIHTRSGELSDNFYDIHDFVTDNEVALLKRLNQVQERSHFILKERIKNKLGYNDDYKLDTISSELLDSIKFIPMLHGEYIGPGINKGTAVQLLSERRYVIFNTSINSLMTSEELLGIGNIDNFDIKDILNIGTGEFREYLGHEYLSEFSAPNSNIDLINDYRQFEVTINLNNLDNAKEELLKLTSEVEEECPYAMAFGVKGTGEGIVWVADDDYLASSSRWWFKTKGDKHSSSNKSKNKNKKRKLILSADELESVKEILEEVLPEWRLEQFLPSNPQLEIIGDYIRAVREDIKKECSDILDKLDDSVLKVVNKEMQDKIKKYFLSNVENLI